MGWSKRDLTVVIWLVPLGMYCKVFDLLQCQCQWLFGSNTGSVFKKRGSLNKPQGIPQQQGHEWSFSAERRCIGETSQQFTVGVTLQRTFSEAKASRPKAQKTKISVCPQTFTGAEDPKAKAFGEKYVRLEVSGLAKQLKIFNVTQLKNLHRHRLSTMTFQKNQKSISKSACKTKNIILYGHLQLFKISPIVWRHSR